MTDRISGSAFKQMIAFGAACVAQQKQAINDLNVFPVPDGDTGTNMSLTIQTAVNELKKSEPAKGLVEMDGPALAAAMGEGVATAYGAVMKPAEGTVLTVSRLAAARAAQAAQENPSAEYVLEQAILAGQETLAQTQEARATSSFWTACCGPCGARSCPRWRRTKRPRIRRISAP